MATPATAKRCAVDCPSGGETVVQRLVRQHSLERRRDGRGLVTIDQQAIDTIAHDVARAGRAGGDDRHAARHGLDEDIAKPFVAGGQCEHIGARDDLPRVALKAAQHHRVLEAARGDARANRRLLVALPQDEQSRRHDGAQQGERVDQQRVVLGFGQPARRHDDRPYPSRRVLRLERRGRRGCHGGQIHRVVHDAHAPPRDAERLDQIVGDTVRRRDDQVGGRVAYARHQREHAAVPAVPPRIVAVGEKRRHRRLLVEHHARADGRGPHRRQHREVAQERHHDIGARLPHEPAQRTPPADPRIVRAGRHAHRRRDVSQVRSFLAEQIHRAIPGGVIERVQNLHRRTLRAATRERRQHEADLSSDGGHS